MLHMITPISVSSRRPLLSFANLIFALALLVLPIGLGGQKSSCNIQKDECPWKMDDECDSGLDRCKNQDCYDCDPCRQYDLKCSDCVDNGCYWCPGDARCYETKLYDLDTSECPNEEDYVEQCDEQENFFSDPLYTAQSWVYDMINVVPVWENGFTGKGVRVRINDIVGVDFTHPEIEGRFDVDASCEEYAATDRDHGTIVASIIAAGANNNNCAVGIAPEARLSACLDSELDVKLGTFDISVNSWNEDACFPQYRHRALQASNCPFVFEDAEADVFPCSVCDFSEPVDEQDICLRAIIEHCQKHYEEDPAACVEFLDLFIAGGECSYNTLSEKQQSALTNAILNGRDGKGVIFVFSAGNEYTIGEDTNFEGYLNTRFTITVGAVGRDGLHASYSTPGAALFLTAPGGDSESLTNFFAASVGGGCADAGIGTSWSAPVVGGVIGLMLEANPALEWRDVQAILAKTSKMVENDPDDDTLVKNAAGISHSNFYGFGIVDADAAVAAAQSWQILEKEKMIVGQSDILNEKIPDDPKSPSISTVSMAEDDETFIAESVVVYVNLTHPSRGDLEIKLTSPHGTTSILHPGNRPETGPEGSGELWKLLTVRNWGESANGEWTLTIKDISKGFVNNCADFTPWEAVTQENGEDVILTCPLFQRLGVCRNGFVNDDWFAGDNDLRELFDNLNDNGLSAVEACCACGGGGPTNKVANQLLQWSLVVYGQSMDPNFVPDDGTEFTPDVGDDPSATPNTDTDWINNITGPVVLATLFGTALVCYLPARR